MIQISELSFKYNEQLILNSLNLDIKPKEIVAIVGHSGCGKSTLLNLIAGILKPYRGSITVNTKNVSYLMQDVTLLSYKTALENVFLAYKLRFNTINKSTINFAHNLLNLFQIENSTYNKFPNELSGGTKQKIGIIQTLLTDPELLLLDEPFNAIDVYTLETIESFIWNFVNKQERTMVFITHNIEQALLLSNRIIIMGRNYSLHNIVPSTNYISYTPSKRVNTEEFRSLFFEITDKMKQ